MDDKELIKGLLERIKRGAEEIGQTLKANEDWRTMAILASDAPEGGTALSAAPLEFRNEQEKEATFEVLLPALVAERGARAMVLVLPSWTAKFREDLPDVRPSESPDRQEVLIVIGASLGHLESWQSPVIRSQTHPVLGPWENLSQFVPSEKVEIRSWIIESALNALQRSAASRN